MSPDRFQGDDRALAAYKAGQVDERLDNADSHFAIINGSIAASAIALTELRDVVVELKTKVRLAAWLLAATFSAILAGIATYLATHHP